MRIEYVVDILKSVTETDFDVEDIVCKLDGDIIEHSGDLVVRNHEETFEIYINSSLTGDDRTEEILEGLCCLIMFTNYLQEDNESTYIKGDNLSDLETISKFLDLIYMEI